MSLDPAIRLDPVLLEIFFHKFTAVAEEMAITLQRSARTTYVKEAGDFGTALAEPSGRFFAYPKVLGVSGFLDSDVGPSLAAIPDLEPGDVIITNHPYLSEGLSTHMPDLHLIRPIFHEGRIVAHAWDFIHSADVGGGVPSSISPRFSELFQEGFQIPPMKLVKAGVMNEDFLTLYRSNCRTPEVNLGDIQAMLAALQVGEKRVLELVAAHGVDTVMQAQRDLVAYAGAKARQVQRLIPDGDYVFWDYLDDDYNSRIPVRLRCRLQARDGHVHLDFTGSDPQVEAAYNVPTGGKRHVWLTLKLMHFVYSHDKTIPLNHGMFEHITVEAPRGTIVNPTPPAAVGVRAATAIRINEALVGALSTASPGLMPAPSGGVMIPSVLVEQRSAEWRAQRDGPAVARGRYRRARWRRRCRRARFKPRQPAQYAHREDRGRSGGCHRRIRAASGFRRGRAVARWNRRRIQRADRARGQRRARPRAWSASYSVPGGWPADSRVRRPGSSSM